MSKYILHFPCDLKHEININAVFIGKKFPINILGYTGYVLFPIIDSQNEEHDFKLISPKLQGARGEFICGKYSKSVFSNDTTQYHPQIARVYIVLNIDCDIHEDYKTLRQIIEEAERVTSKFIKCIGIIHPSAIHWSYSKEEGYIESTKIYSFIDTSTNKDYGIAGSVTAYLAMPEQEVTTKEFFYIYRNFTKNISLQYELLSDVYRCIKRNEYREAILNCATIIEKTLKEQIGAYLDKENTTSIITEFILKSADGFDKILKVMKKFGLSVDNCNDIKDRTIFIRNRVIHGGYFPTKEEVERAIEDAKLIMKQYNVPLFID